MTSSSTGMNKGNKNHIAPIPGFASLSYLKIARDHGREIAKSASTVTKCLYSVGKILHRRTCLASTYKRTGKDPLKKDNIALKE